MLSARELPTVKLCTSTVVFQLPHCRDSDKIPDAADDDLDGKQGQGWAYNCNCCQLALGTFVRKARIRQRLELLLLKRCAAYLKKEECHELHR